MKRKKIIATILSLSLIVCTATGCKKDRDNSSDETTTEEIELEEDETEETSDTEESEETTTEETEDTEASEETTDESESDASEETTETTGTAETTEETTVAINPDEATSLYLGESFEDFRAKLESNGFDLPDDVVSDFDCSDYFEAMNSSVANNYDVYYAFKFDSAEDARSFFENSSDTGFTASTENGMDVIIMTDSSENSNSYSIAYLNEAESLVIFHVHITFNN